MRDRLSRGRMESRAEKTSSGLRGSRPMKKLTHMSRGNRVRIRK